MKTKRNIKLEDGYYYEGHCSIHGNVMIAFIANNCMCMSCRDENWINEDKAIVTSEGKKWLVDTLDEKEIIIQHLLNKN